MANGEIFDLCHYTDILEAMPDALVITNHTGHIVFINQSAETLFGYARSELLKKTVECLMPVRFRHNHIDLRKNYNKHPEKRLMGIGLELFSLKKNGIEFPVEISLSPLHIKDASYTCAAIRDITYQKNIEQKGMVCFTIISSSDDVIIGTDLQGRITIWNKSAERLYGYTQVEAVGQSMELIFKQNAHQDFLRMKDIIVRGEHYIQHEMVTHCKNGTIIPVSITVSPIFSTQGNLIGSVSIARNITQQKHHEAKLMYDAQHDPLTGLINQALFNDRLEHAKLLSKRHKQNIVVCFIDIDDFKYVNDTYGHAVGDAVLSALATCFRESLRQSDTIARMGGDEFAVLLLGLNDADAVFKILKKIVDRVAKGFVIDNTKITITLSIGVSFYSEHETQSSLERADAAMYYVKHHGKNNIKFTSIDSQ